MLTYIIINNNLQITLNICYYSKTVSRKNLKHLPLIKIDNSFSKYFTNFLVTYSHLKYSIFNFILYIFKKIIKIINLFIYYVT